jgi:hypothetical protein
MIFTQFVLVDEICGLGIKTRLVSLMEFLISTVSVVELSVFC